MLVYIIDGFNLVHSIPDLKNSDNPHTDLIHYIKANRLTGSRNNKVVIAFDGGVNSESVLEREFEIIFSGRGSADDLIVERLKKIKNKSETIVVSNDRQIRDAVKRQGAKSLKVADFIKKKKRPRSLSKEISYTLEHEITEEMRKIWLGD